MLTEYQATQLTRSARAILAPADRRPAYLWAGDNIALHKNYAQEGRFCADRWMIPIFDALHDPLVREVTLQAPIQLGKTLIADIWVSWLIVNQPGPIMWTFQSDEMAKDHGKTRLVPLLKRNEATRAVLPRYRNNVTADRIIFDDFFLILNSANLNHLQSKSIRYKINSELWLPSWSGMMVHARGRVRRFEELGTSKIYNESQGGSENTEIDLAYRSGSRGRLAVDCGGGLSPLVWTASLPDNKKAGVVWSPDAYDAEGNLSKSRVVESVRYRCPVSGIELDDSDRTRQLWANTCGYIHDEPENTIHRSFNLPAMIRQPLKVMAAKYVDAYNFMRAGNPDPMRDFVTKDLAQTWVEQRESTVTLADIVESDFETTTYAAIPIEGEVGRVMSVDCQQDHFWVAVHAFTHSKIKALYYARIETEEEFEPIRKAYMVKPKATVVDDRYDPTRTHSICLRYGYISIGGYPQQSFPKRTKDGKEYRSLVSDLYRIQHQGKFLFGVKFASDPIKDMASAYLQPPTRLTWASDIAPEYTEQLTAEERREIRPGVHRWTKIKKRNDSWDTLAMALSLAVAAKWIRASSADIDNDADED
jgi:phage terminase large subunit GpA-like protein